MAKIENIKFAEGPYNTTDIINVSASVGVNGVNRSEDIIIVQALLKYGLEGRTEFRDAEFPEPSGAFVKTTAKLIKKYQRFNNRSEGVRVSIDGRIDPLTGSVFAYGKKKHWTIYSLNVHAEEMSLVYYNTPLIEGICKRWPFIGEMLNKNGVGTLGLPLE